MKLTVSFCGVTLCLALMTARTSASAIPKRYYASMERERAQTEDETPINSPEMEDFRRRDEKAAIAREEEEEARRVEKRIIETMEEIQDKELIINVVKKFAASNPEGTYESSKAWLPRVDTCRPTPTRPYYF